MDRLTQFRIRTGRLSGNMIALVASTRTARPQLQHHLQRAPLSEPSAIESRVLIHISVVNKIRTAAEPVGELFWTRFGFQRIPVCCGCDPHRYDRESIISVVLPRSTSRGHTDQREFALPFCCEPRPRAETRRPQPAVPNGQMPLRAGGLAIVQHGKSILLFPARSHH